MPDAGYLVPKPLFNNPLRLSPGPPMAALFYVFPSPYHPKRVLFIHIGWPPPETGRKQARSGFGHPQKTPEKPLYPIHNAILI